MTAQMDGYTATPQRFVKWVDGSQELSYKDSGVREGPFHFPRWYERSFIQPFKEYYSAPTLQTETSGGPGFGLWLPLLAAHLMTISNGSDRNWKWYPYLVQ